jgi:hypothetical protein
MKLHLPRRPGLTLVELMVVVGLIIVLATLVVGVANSSLVDSYKVVGSADRLSGWLLQAKSRALRDRVPVGLRLIRAEDNPNFVRQAQMVEMPALYAPNQDSNANTIPAGAPFVAVRYSTNATGDLIQDFAASPHEAGVYLFWPNNVSPYPSFTPGTDLNVGDLLRLNELGSTHRITAVNVLPSAPSWFPTIPAGVIYRLTLAISPVDLPNNEFYPTSPPYPANLLPQNVAAIAPGMAGTVQPYPTGYPAIGGANYYQSRYFGLFRASRPILGEPLLQLPANMAIDLSPGVATTPGDRALSVNVPANTTNTDNEIIFNPNGSVLHSEAGLIGLWLRDTRNSAGQSPLYVTGTAPNPVNPAILDVYVDRKRLMDAGEHVLVTIYTRTGAISTYPIFPPDLQGRYDGRPVNNPPALGGPGDSGIMGPYKFALQATNTGL